MKNNASKTIAFTRTAIMTVAAITVASLTAVAANAAKSELPRSWVVVPVTAAKGTAAKNSPTNKNASQERGETPTSTFAEKCTPEHSALDAPVLAPYKRPIENSDAHAAFV